MHVFAQGLVFEVLSDIAEINVLFGKFGMEAAFGKQAVVNDAVDSIIVGSGKESNLSNGSCVNGWYGDDVFINMEEWRHEI